MIYFKKARRKKIMARFFFFRIMGTESKRRVELRVLFCLGVAGTSGQWRVHKRLEENKKKG